MSKLEFLDELKEALVQEMDSSNIQEQLSYYRAYIDGEIQAGRSEQTVVAELGDPWALAKNLGTSVNQDSAYVQHETISEQGDIESEQSARGRGKTFSWRTHSSLGCWIFAVLVILIIFGVLYLLIGAISVLAPVLIPVLLVMIIVRWIQTRK